MGDLHRIGSATGWRLTFRAAKTAVFTSALFLVVYGFTNWLTAQRPRSQVGEWWFQWELDHIAFQPLLMIPYVSIDFFYFFGPFLCRSETELRVLGRRLTFSTLAAAAYFLAFPLRLCWPPLPQTPGLFGDFIKESSNAPFLMEYPHNLFPTLHIATAMILANTFARHSPRWLGYLLYAWFFLIGISTVLTHQHHVIDVAGGLLLGAFAYYFFREETTPSQVTPNVRIGLYYAVAAAVLLVLVPFTLNWGIFLTWPAAGLGTIAASYFGVGPGVFRKNRGRLPWCTYVAQAPALFGQWLSLLYYRRQCRAWDEIAPGLLVGRVLSDAEAANAIGQGVTAVLDLTAEFSEAAPFRTVTYRNLPILDLTAPTHEQLREAVAFLVEESARGTVYLHCKIGYSRSAAVAGAYLIASGVAANTDDAIARLRAARPTIVVRPEAEAALRTFEMF